MDLSVPWGQIRDALLAVLDFPAEFLRATQRQVLELKEGQCDKATTDLRSSMRARARFR